MAGGGEAKMLHHRAVTEGLAGKLALVVEGFAAQLRFGALGPTHQASGA